MLMGWMGATTRWRTMPWMVTFFFILVVPLGLVHITLVILQPVAVGHWCTVCLAAASLMLLMIPLAVDEIENRLTAIDAGIAESLWGAAGAAERESMLASARGNLHPYAASMQREAFEDLIRRQALSTSRQKQGIPHLSLFYL